MQAQPKGGGVLGADKAQGRGGLRCGHNQKKRRSTRKGGYLELVLKKERVLRIEVSQKKGLGSLFIYYLLLSIIFIVQMINRWRVFCQTEKGRGP